MHKYSSRTAACTVVATPPLPKPASTVPLALNRTTPNEEPVPFAAVASPAQTILSSDCTARRGVHSCMYLPGQGTGASTHAPTASWPPVAAARDKGPIARAGLSNVSLERLRHASGRRHSGSSGHPEPDNLRAARPHGWHGPRHSDSAFCPVSLPTAWRPGEVESLRGPPPLGRLAPSTRTSYPIRPPSRSGVAAAVPCRLWLPLRSGASVCPPTQRNSLLPPVPHAGAASIARPGPADLARQLGQRNEKRPDMVTACGEGQAVKGDAHDPGPKRAAQPA